MAPKRRRIQRVIQKGGKLIPVRSVVALADAVGIARITLKRQWEKAGVLPEPTLVDSRGARWYSEDYVRTAVIVVRRWRSARYFGTLSELAKLFRATWKQRRVT
jgi:hypothetical protein